MRSFRKTKRQNEDTGYNIAADFPLINSAMCSRYGMSTEEVLALPWTDFITKMSDLSAFSRFNAIVRIRTEKDPKVIRDFTEDEREIRRQWKEYIAGRRRLYGNSGNGENYDENSQEAFNMIAEGFGLRG